MLRRSARARDARAAFWSTLLAAGSAQAQVAAPGAAASNATQAQAQAIDVTIVGGGGESGALLDTLRELLARLGLAVKGTAVAMPSARDAGASASDSTSLSVQIDLVSPYEAVAIVRGARGEFRRTIPRVASPSIVREEIGETVRSAVESQLLTDDARPRPRVTQPEPPRLAVVPPVPPPPVVPPPSGIAVDVTTRAGAALVAPGAGVAGRLGGGVVLSSRQGLHPSMTLVVEYGLPFDATALAVDSRASLSAVRAVAAVEVWRTSWIVLQAGAGGGIDVVSVNPTVAPTVTVDAATRVDPVGTARLTALVPLTPGVAFTLEVGADFDVTSYHYQVRTASGEKGDALAPRNVRPSALAGFTFTAFGAGLFASRGLQ